MNRLFYIVVLVLFPLAFYANNYVIINQVMYDTPLNEQVDITPYSLGEFVELYNGGAENVSLLGWSIVGDGSTEIFVFPDWSIPSHGYMILAYKHDARPQFVLSDLYDMPELSLQFQVKYQNAIVLANKGENLSLYNSNHELVDHIYFDGTSHKTNPKRLCAENDDDLAGSQCVSLHRTWVEFDKEGLVVPGCSQWKTEVVTFGTNMLSETSFFEHYLIGGEHNLPTNQNYIISVTPLDPTSRVSISDGGISVSNGVRTATSVNYYDGLGRLTEKIDIEASPVGLDMVELSQYSGLNREHKKWLPIPIATEGDFVSLEDVQSFAQSYYLDNRPFTETLYENTALNRVTGMLRPGVSWQSHPISKAYAVNDGYDDVRIYTVGEDGTLKTTGATYLYRMLYKNTTIDEDGVSLTTYTDKLGRVIMDDRKGLRTYYVYDDMGRLRYVLPHSAQSHLTSGEYNPNNSILSASAYYYQYDKRGNVIYKRLPGCAPQYFVYDKGGQLALSQNGNQREKNIWAICAYDSIGRVLYTAEIPLTQSHEDLITLFADKWQVEHYGGNRSGNIVGTRYASTILGTRGLKLLSVNYYDNYDYLSLYDTPMRQSLRFEHESGYGLQYDNANGLLTGARIYNLSETDYTAIAYYYDIKGRVVQSRSWLSNGEKSTVSNIEYLYEGSISQSLSIQNIGSESIREHYRYVYDHTGRVKETFYQLNDEPEVALSSFVYDSIGRLAQNLLYNHQDTILYAYDIRNMLTEIQNKHFSERLYYADNLPESATACYNGNIAASIVSHADSVYAFSYGYDQQNRLLSSMLIKEHGTVPSELFEYDEMGNLLSLKRYYDGRALDNLEYWYGNYGNQVLAITDKGTDADRYDVVEYHNGISVADTTMRYDANGNLIFDADRGISAIRYNILNLPDTIQFANGNQIVNLYDATGHKYRSVIYTNLATAVTPCWDIVHYSLNSDSVEYRVVEYTGNIETIYTLRDTIRRINNSIGYFCVVDSSYYYTVNDHLGNVCAVVNANSDSLVQSTLYYASGVPMAQSFGREVQPYLYNGKEFVGAHGYDVFDYGFRGYYATIGRFTSVDPLSEWTPWQSPYIYAVNNPICNVDWMGLAGIMSGHITSLNWVAINSDGQIVDLGGYNEGDDGYDDYHVYLVDEYWDGTYAGLSSYEIVGRELSKSSTLNGFYIRYRTTVKYDDSGITVIGENVIVSSCFALSETTINDTFDAFEHYMDGDGSAAFLGPQIRTAFLLSGAINKILSRVKEGSKRGAEQVDFTCSGQYHIGDSNCSYNVIGNSLLITFAAGDGFWDVRVVSEKLGVEGDHEGPALELSNSHPYPYVPFVIMIGL